MSLIIVNELWHVLDSMLDHPIIFKKEVNLAVRPRHHNPSPASLNARHQVFMVAWVHWRGGRNTGILRAWLKIVEKCRDAYQPG
jgi:hypothetical protein